MSIFTKLQIGTAIVPYFFKIIFVVLEIQKPGNYYYATSFRWVPWNKF